MKICDFGSDNPLYARDYYEMGASRLLIPIRWMAWESVMLVSHFIYLRFSACGELQ